MYYRYFPQENINHISDLLKNNGKLRSWEDLRAKLDLGGNKKFYCIQIIHTISRARKEVFLECGDNINNLVINEHHLIKKHRIYYLVKLNRRELYKIQLILKVE